MQLGHIATTLVLAFSIAGCQQAAPKTYGDLEQDYAKKELEAHPVGRYQFIGKQTFPNGDIEYTCLDTATGEIGYATIYADPKKLAQSGFNCAN